jgi:spore germination cell wall hydrolase CwlJ-like protein
MMSRPSSSKGPVPRQFTVLRRSRRLRIALRWALATVAPWALSTGLLVSFTASAGQPRDTAETLVLWASPALSSELAFSSGHGAGRSLLSAISAFNLPALSLHDALIPGRYDTARYSYEEPQRLVPMNEHKPRDMLKSNAGGFPELDRSKKTDPLVSLRPGVSQTGPGLSGDELDRLLFDNAHGELTAQFAPDTGDAPSEPQGFVPFDYALTPQDSLHPSDASPPTASAATPQESAPLSRSAERRLESIDGSTPSAPRALALSSATPVQQGLAPIEIAAAPVTGRVAEAMALVPSASGTQGAPGSYAAPAEIIARPARAVTVARKSTNTTVAERPDYAALIGTDNMEREQKCLAEAVYYEARSEPEEGQAAVAQVVLNRVKSGLYPANVCGVVYQNRHRYLGCQFTFACEGRALRITEPESWETAKRVAREVTDGRIYLADVGNSTHYHATYVRPWWARRLTKMDAIGRHVFYKLKPGQT